MEAIGGSTGKENLACIVEDSHGLLIAFLLEQGWHVSPLHPTTVDRRHTSVFAKTDPIDASLLAKTGRADLAKLRRLTPGSDQIAKRKALTHGQDSLIQMQTRLVNQLTADLKASYSAALDLLARLQQRSTLTFLQTDSTLQAARAASQKGRASADRETPPKIVETLHQPHLSASVVTTRTKSRLLWH